jgi:hypothetical protein
MNSRVKIIKKKHNKSFDEFFAMAWDLNGEVLEQLTALYVANYDIIGMMELSEEMAEKGEKTEQQHLNISTILATIHKLNEKYP